MLRFKAERLDSLRKRKAKPTDELNQLRTEVESLKKHVDQLWEHAQESAERLQDIEVHLNLLTRLLTVVFVEKLGMRIGVLKRLVKRIEKEVIRDSQIYHLENLYKLHHAPARKQDPPGTSSKDQWDDVS